MKPNPPLLSTASRVPRGSSPARVLGALLTVGLLAAGCSDSPTDPDRELTFTGLMSRNAKIDHPLPMPHGGNLTVTLEDLTPRLIDTGVLDPGRIFLLVGLGRPSSTGDCVATTTAGMVEGAVSSYGLRAGDYCLTAFDTGALPEDATLSYTLAAKVTD
jgi:hypothetical protein